MRTNPSTFPVLGLAVLLCGCPVIDKQLAESKTKESSSQAENLDVDEDGFRVGDGDCDDENPAINPGATDNVGDGEDQNCDGIDGTDGDGDGYAAVESGGTDCDDSDPVGTLVTEDADCDGVLTAEDCDDGDSNSTVVATDGDCDGVVTADDCDDGDPNLFAVSGDGDCDGVLTGDDCDDGDPNLFAVSGDGDCDGVATSHDCDDGDPSLLAVGDDMDCDGVLTGDDCDDGDADSTIVATDGDCDGTLTADDCDDADANSTIVATDGDCDGVVTSHDCDDGDANSTNAATDGDCDGTLTADDCDDGDANSTIVATDGDCDGVLAGDDCDDGDAGLLAVSNDGDCDGVLTGDDCDDGDATTINDMDCDGTLTADDCDDADANSTIVATDGDCDGVLAGDDCDDGDAGLLAVSNDGDCDGVLTGDDCDDGSTATGYCGACLSIQSNGLSTGDGTYWLDPGGTGAFQAYCDMTTDGGGWTQIISNDYQVDLCPSGWTMELSENLCYSTISGNSVAPTEIDTLGISYTEILGSMSLRVWYSMDAFNQTRSQSIDDSYVDGVSICTKDISGSRTHVFTYALLMVNGGYVCPAPGVQNPPGFVGSDYFCDLVPNVGQWSGNVLSSGDEFQVSADGSDTIEVRLLSNEGWTNEAAGVSEMYLYVR